MKILGNDYCKTYKNDKEVLHKSGQAYTVLLYLYSIDVTRFAAKMLYLVTMQRKLHWKEQWVGEGMERQVSFYNLRI